MCVCVCLLLWAGETFDRAYTGRIEFQEAYQCRLGGGGGESGVPVGGGNDLAVSFYKMSHLDELRRYRSSIQQAAAEDIQAAEFSREVGMREWRARLADRGLSEIEVPTQCSDAATARPERPDVCCAL